ncbi:MAG: cupin domain-containing protein [Deltaproteobacteria bacterium]|nr:cupin domain-containing protein [Deltaproteobacteria bacterium]
MTDPRKIVAEYRLKRHPEGGWFREVHRSAHPPVRIHGYPGPRATFTVIYFLLARGDFSAFHRLRGEETWIHLAGDPLELVVMSRRVRKVLLDSATRRGKPIAVVPAGALQAARTTGAYTLSACFVAPGFEYADFSIPSREELLRDHPRRKELILDFTR